VSWFHKLRRKMKYGEEIVIVSGLPRSGTSMMMKMLEGGGIPPMTDHVREADVDNPKGYFEYERVKDLEKETDKSYVREGRGKALKVISFLVKHLPDDNFYRVVFMTRDLDEVIASQNKMLDHREEENPIRDQQAKELYRKHLLNIKVHCKSKRNFEFLEVNYRGALDDPAATASRVNAFLDGRLDERAMTNVVDKSLYRNRKDDLDAKDETLPQETGDPGAKRSRESEEGPKR